jgi:para-nitrobenzyl esterase
VNRRPAGRTNVSEDCLYLNVWTPEWPAKSRKPVMLWIHGGGNFAGSSSEGIFDGEQLAERGIVLVSANYRLGVRELDPTDRHLVTCIADAGIHDHF